MAQTAFQPAMRSYGSRNRFTTHRCTASRLLNVIAKQNGTTNPTYHDVLNIMDLRYRLEEEEFQMTRITNSPPRSKVANKVDTVKDALSASEDFLRRMADVDGVFQTTASDCMELEAEIMVLVIQSWILTPRRLQD